MSFFIPSGSGGGGDTVDYEKYLYSVIYLPAEIAARRPLAVHSRLRVDGKINDYPFSGAFIPSSQGHHLILGSARLKAMGLKVGMPIEADDANLSHGHSPP